MPRREGCYLTESRGRRMNGRWGRWVPIGFLSISAKAAASWVEESVSPILQYRARHYIPAPMPKKARRR